MDLFEWGDSQNEHLKRVGGKIGVSVKKFCDEPEHEWFHAEELREWVLAECDVAPASPDRILRDLRQKKVINYEVVDRRMSYYHVLPLGAPGVDVDLEFPDE